MVCLHIFKGYVGKSFKLELTVQVLLIFHRWRVNVMHAAAFIYEFQLM